MEFDALFVYAEFSVPRPDKESFCRYQPRKQNIRVFAVDLSITISSLSRPIVFDILTQFDMATVGIVPAVAPVLAPSSQQSHMAPRKALPLSLIDGAQISIRTPFDATKHVNFEFPKMVVTMKDIGLDGLGITPTAVSEPFPLFTEEAIKQMRAEVFSRQILEKYQVGSEMAINMVRGYCPENSSFVYDAWNSPTVLEALFKVAGIDLVPAMDVDVGHVNISVRGDSADASTSPKSDDRPAFDWHSDSYAFVCVIMLSDCTGMIGGETAIRTGTGEVMKFRGPVMGTAVIMQGRCIEPQALKVFGGRECISTVTSLRPKSPFVRDETSIEPLFNISPRSRLYHECAEYRLENLEERVRHQLKVIRTAA
ncbi:hypothetical protein BBP40_009803 [Aspergillus hancockii]|nr:hypothetical protein BBP40_009803 [Aspergillus hancockii]